MQKIPLNSRSTPHRDLRGRIDKCPKGDPLPLVHVTEMGFGRDIIFSGQLLAKPCSVFKRELLYFFLGRPAYRLKHEDEPSRQISRYPCVFIVDPSRVDPIQSFPFDTGALARGLYRGADPHLAIRDYQLSGGYDSALQCLTYAFDSLDDYFEGRVRAGLDEGVPVFDQATRSYLQIARQAARGVNEPDTYDDRASAIELATDTHLDLKGAVELAILPEQFLEGPDQSSNSALISELNGLEISTDVYEWRATRSPGDYRTEINEKVLAHCKARQVK